MKDLLRSPPFPKQMRQSAATRPELCTADGALAGGEIMAELTGVPVDSHGVCTQSTLRRESAQALSALRALIRLTDEVGLLGWLVIHCNNCTCRLSLHGLLDGIGADQGLPGSKVMTPQPQPRSEVHGGVWKRSQLRPHGLAQHKQIPKDTVQEGLADRRVPELHEHGELAQTRAM